MKLTFSTRGWQHLGWNELIGTAVESGLNGLEIYDLPKLFIIPFSLFC